MISILYIHPFILTFSFTVFALAVATVDSE